MVVSSIQVHFCFLSYSHFHFSTMLVHQITDILMSAGLK